MDVSDWISVFRTMTEDLPRIGSLASLDPNKAFPIDLTSHASVGGLILLGSLVVFVVGWAVLAVAIYCWRGRKAPVIFPHGPDARNSIVCVKLEEHESHDPKKVKLQHVNKKTNISDCSMIGIDKSIASSSRYLTPSSCKRAPTTSSRRDMNREDFEEPL
ncbi:uncharacterized protein LOC111247737 [Varroa destructor]|uniref:Uncharacterized protein n=2 Tax=Varroa TaxID=62624 RepID=A0A7M7JYS7_VARDE|nr:uncharacterized protein LOC111247737 [Varroa destructor]